jgi:hypothetical protein
MSIDYLQNTDWGDEFENAIKDAISFATGAVDAQTAGGFTRGIEWVEDRESFKDELCQIKRSDAYKLGENIGSAVSISKIFQRGIPMSSRMNKILQEGASNVIGAGISKTSSCQP